MNTLQTINNHPVMKAVLADSFGGIMYNVANYGKYDAKEVLSIWNSMSAGERSAAGGIVKGAINFLQGN